MPRPDAIGWGTRHWGIEFEFSRMCSQEALQEAVRFALPSLDPGLLRMADWEHTPNNNRDWVVKRDGSCGWEICTPKSKSLADMDRVQRVLAAVKLVGATVNSWTGVHIHYETRDFDTTIMGRLVGYWIKSEGMLFWSLPRSRRGNRYCLHLSRAGNIKSRGHYSPEDLVRIAGATRYQALNLKPWLSDCGRIEIRVIEGSLDGEEVKNWTAFFLYWINRVVASEYPVDLRWQGLEEWIDWMGWSPGVQQPSVELETLRMWWLRRFIKYCSIRGRTGQYRKRARAILAQVKGAALAPVS